MFDHETILQVSIIASLVHARIHWSKVVSPHLWNTIINLYQQAIFEGIPFTVGPRGRRLSVCDIAVCCNLGGGFKHILVSPLPGEMIQFDE